MNINGFEVEETGGGCQWLRRGNLAITDGECGIPASGEPCMVFELDANGDVTNENGIPFQSLEAAFAWCDQQSAK